MKDRSVEFPNRYRLVPVAGTTGIVDIVPAPGEVTDEGTAINKAALLKDTTANLYELGPDAAPDDILRVIGERPPVFNAYTTDLYLYITGNHPILNAGVNDYTAIKSTELIVPRHRHSSRTIHTGDRSHTIFDGVSAPLKVLAGGN